MFLRHQYDLDKVPARITGPVASSDLTTSAHAIDMILDDRLDTPWWLDSRGVPSRLVDWYGPVYRNRRSMPVRTRDESLYLPTIPGVRVTECAPVPLRDGGRGPRW